MKPVSAPFRSVGSRFRQRDLQVLPGKNHTGSVPSSWSIIMTFMTFPGQKYLARVPGTKHPT